MTTRMMTENQIARFTKDMEVQGVGVTRTKKGLMLRLPDGSAQMKHFTESDVRGPRNLASALRRAGITMPGERVAELPAYITEGSVKETTKQRVFEWVRRCDYPDVVYAKDYIVDEGVDAASANRHLYHSGFVCENAISKKKGRPWRTPEWLNDEGREKRLAEEEKMLESQPIHEAMELVQRAQAAQQAVNDLGAGPVQNSEPVVQTSEDREFIDTHDSWVVDLTRLPLSMPIGEYIQAMHASGMEVEFRLWRK